MWAKEQFAFHRARPARLSRFFAWQLSAPLVVLVAAGSAWATAITRAPVATVAGRQLTIHWQTDTPATSELAWGTNSAANFATYPFKSLSPQYGLTHSKTVRRPPPGTYFYRVRSADFSSAVESAEFSVTVPAAEAYPLGDLSVAGGVLASTQLGNTLYVAGNFRAVGETTGAAIALNNGTGAPSTTDFPEVTGSVATIVTHAGGVILGGSFGSVGGLPRANTARLLTDRGIDPDWNVTTNGEVRTLYREGATLYLGGSFTEVNGQPRTRAAAVDVATGALLPWNPEFNNTVNSLIATSQAVYVAGAFDRVNGSVQRNFAASVDLVTGVVTSWNPNLANQAFAIIANDVESRIYIGGAFLTVNGNVSRTHLASFDPVNGVATAFNPSPSLWVYALSLDANTLYVGGSFSSIGAVPQKYLAAVDGTTGAVLAWSPVRNALVLSLAHTPTRVYVGGQPGFIAPGAPLIEAFDRTTGATLSWQPLVAGDSVDTICTSLGDVFIGGHFSIANGYVTRNGTAAFDMTTGALLPWAPVLVGDPSTIDTDGTSLFLGGSFVITGGSPRTNAAAFDSDAQLLGWNPSPDNGVTQLIVRPPAVYLGGGFTTVNGGTPRRSVAAVDLDAGTSLPWNPNVIAAVQTIDTVGSTLYAGGFITAVNGSTGRQNGAAFDVGTSVATSWAPTFDLPPRVFSILGSAVYAGGPFLNVNSTPAEGLVKLDVATATALAGGTVSGSVSAIAPVRNAAVVVGGRLTAANQAPRQNIAAFDLDGGLLPWAPSVVGTVTSVRVDCTANIVAIGGSILGVGAAPRAGLALIDGQSLCFSASGSVDAGSADAGEPDAGHADAGSDDAGVPDAGHADAGSDDSGLPDAGEVDAGASDAGDGDAGMVDAGDPDAGPADAGDLDAGAPDASMLPTDGGPVPDGGMPDADAGTDGARPRGPNRFAVGCGCRVNEPFVPVAALALALSWWARNARRRSSARR